MVPRTFYTLVALCFAALVSAQEQSYVDLPADVAVEGTRCTRLAVRREWRDLEDEQKKSYLDAVKCLTTTPAVNATGSPEGPEGMTLFDEFVLSHMESAEAIHGVAQFLPWHRHFGHLYEKALRDACKYNGPIPYWDWERDTAGDRPISESPLFDTELGFGGDGVEGTYTVPTDDDGSVFPLIPPAFKGCVGSGPFKDVVVRVGPNKRFTDHCIVRNFAESVRPALAPEHIAGINGQQTYDEFWNALDGLPFKPEPRLHDAGHGFMGGDMTSFYTSNNDPVFYLHHAGLDRVWWEWQLANPSRLTEMNGRVNNTPPFGEVSLDYSMDYAGVYPAVPLRSAMDIRAEPYCYTYDNTPKAQAASSDSGSDSSGNNNGAASRGVSALMLALPFLLGAYYL